MPYTIQYPEGESKNMVSEKESTGSYIGRNLARTAGDVAAGVIGLPGDIVQGGISLANLASGALSGPQIPDLDLPTSDKFREKILNPIAERAGSPEYFTPRGSGEQLLSDIAKDVGSLFLPIKSKLPFGKALKSAGKIAAGSNIAGWLGEGLTGSPALGSALKIGATLALPFWGSKEGIKSLTDSVYSSAREGIPEGSLVGAQKLEKGLSKLKDYASTGGGLDPEKDKILSMVDKFSSRIKDGLIKAKDLWESKVELNDILSDSFPEYRFGKKSKALLGDFSKSIRDNLYQYGSLNPNFGIPFKMAESLYQGIRPISHIHNFIDKWLPKNMSPDTLRILGISPKHVLKSAGRFLPTIAGNVEKNISMLGNKDVRRYYTDIMNDALSNNSSKIIKDIGKLDKVIRKSPNQGRYTIEYPS